MKGMFGIIVFGIVACSNRAKQEEKVAMSPEKEAITITFEGKEFIKLNDTTYQREEDDRQIFLTLFSDRNIKSIEHQGNFQGCGVLVDTSRYFNVQGTLIKQIYHENWMPENAEGCHSSVQDLHITEFFESGKVKAKKYYRMGYEALQRELGTWNEFDENGNTISTINYGDPYTADEFLAIEFLEKLEHYIGSSYNQSILSKRGFSPVLSSTEGEYAYVNDEKNKIVMSKIVFDDGESIFWVEYYVNRNRLVAFEQALKQTEGIYSYRGSSEDAYFKRGMGSYRTKKVKIDLDKGLVIYSHRLGKELDMQPPIFELREL